MDDVTRNRGRRRRAGAAALVVGGALAGAAFVGVVTSASADEATADGTTAQQGEAAPGAGTRDESKSQRPDESLLTGDDAAKVTAAALAKYPGATIQRVETDSDGVYEAHLTTADGKRVTVEVGADFAVTGEEAGGPGGPGGMPPGGGAGPGPVGQQGGQQQGG